MMEQQKLVKAAEVIQGLIDNVPMTAKDRSEMYVHLQTLLIAAKDKDQVVTFDEPGTLPPPPKNG